MITGTFDQRGRPVITVWVQVVRNPLEKTGPKVPVDFVIATGSKRTTLGAADAARLGITAQDTHPTAGHSPMYWQHIDQPMRTLNAQLNFQDDWKSPDATFEIDMLDFTHPGVDNALPSYIGMDIMQNWEIIMDPANSLLKIIPTAGAMTPPDGPRSPGDEPHTIDQAFTLSTDRHEPNPVLVTSEDFRKVADRFLGLEGIPAYAVGHQNPQVQLTISGVPVNFHMEAYTSASDRLQIWMQATVPSQPDAPVATARFSWGATGDAADRLHQRIRTQMADNRPRNTGP